MCPSRFESDRINGVKPFCSTTNSPLQTNPTAIKWTNRRKTEFYKMTKSWAVNLHKICSISQPTLVGIKVKAYLLERFTWTVFNFDILPVTKRTLTKKYKYTITLSFKKILSWKFLLTYRNNILRFKNVFSASEPESHLSISNQDSNQVFTLKCQKQIGNSI